MLANDSITLGRSPESTIMLRDTQVSRLHLAIEFNQQMGGYVLQDLQSTNGSFLNGIRIT